MAEDWLPDVGVCQFTQLGWLINFDWCLKLVLVLGQEAFGWLARDRRPPWPSC